MLRAPVPAALAGWELPQRGLAARRAGASSAEGYLVEGCKVQPELQLGHGAAAAGPLDGGSGGGRLPHDRGRAGRSQPGCICMLV